MTNSFGYHAGHKPIWFAAALLLQALVLAGIPLQQAPARLSGPAILLDAQAGYPHGTVTGFQVELDYDITNIIPYDEVQLLANGSMVYLILSPDGTGSWQAVNYLSTAPMNLAEDRSFIVAWKQDRGLVMGIETYHFPEAQAPALRDALENSARRVQVEVSIDAAGNAVLQGLRAYGGVY